MWQTGASAVWNNKKYKEEEEKRKNKTETKVWHVDLIIFDIRFLLKYKIKTQQGLAINLCYHTTQ